MNNEQVAHVWAQQQKTSGKSGNMFFEGPSIYSYGRHFEIARFIEPGIVFFTTRGYSNSTARHKNHVLQAVSHKRVFEVDTFDDHKANVSGMVLELDKLAVRIARSGRFADLHVREYETKLDSLKAYGQLFWEEMGKVASKKAWKEFERLSKADFSAALAKHKLAIAAEQKRQDIKRKSRELLEAQELAKWKAGEPTALRFSTMALRLNGSEIETTQGARVPVLDALRFYSRVKAGENVHGDRIGEFTVASFDGITVKIGCHNIPLVEMDRLAATIPALDGIEKPQQVAAE